MDNTTNKAISTAPAHQIIPRSYAVTYTSTGKFSQRYPTLKHLPFILDSRPGYDRLGNAYLIDRGLGLWGPELRGEALEGRIPAPKTIHNYAQWLANFLEWAELRNIPLEKCDYATHIAGRYQTEMLKGLWSRAGTPLKATTVNLRVQAACDFLTWMADKGKREAFTVPFSIKSIKVGSAVSSVGHLHKTVRARKGKVRAKTKSLHMPNDAAVNAWLKRVDSKFGATAELLCESILLTGIRREEAVCLRTDTLPENQKDWPIANPSAPQDKQQVRITLKFGTKGPCYGMDHGDKIGPEQDILIPLTLALRWHEYRRNTRNKAFACWVKDFKGKARIERAAESVHLFLRESDGARFKAGYLYSIWVGVERPIEGWSPHKARNWWACSVLWRELKKHECIVQVSDETATALLESTALSIIRLQIQPQLRHAQDSTTMLYLRWVMNMLGVPVTLDTDDGDLAETEEEGDAD